MFRLRKGKSGNLKGEVLIYVHNTKLINDAPKYPALFSVIEKEEGVTKELGDIFNLCDPKKTIDYNVISLFMSSALPINLGSLKETEKYEGDVLFGGKVYGIEFADPLLRTLAQAYTLSYASQVFRRHFNIGVSNIGEAFNDTYRDYKGKALKQKLYGIIKELFYYLENRDTKGEKRSIVILQKFMEGSNLSQDIANIVGFAKTDHPRKVEIIKAYCDKICATLCGDYEKAAEKMQGLENLLKGEQKQ